MLSMCLMGVLKQAFSNNYVLLLQKSSLPRASLSGTSLPGQRCQICPPYSLDHGSY